jgi:hypothetical protein
MTNVKRSSAIVIALLSLTFAGVAVADVIVSGDNAGTVSIGQQLVIAVNDSLSGGVPGGLPYALCGANGAVPSGRFSVAPLSPSRGGSGWVSLSTSCSGSATWNYSGSLTITVPSDAGGSMAVSVAVQEFVPLQSVGCSPLCTSEHDYNFNQTYTVVTPSTTSTSGSGTTSSGTSTTTPTATTTTISTVAATSTTTPAATTTSAAPPTTSTATTTTLPVTTTQTSTDTRPSSTTTVATITRARVVINVPSKIAIHQAGAFVYITITSSDRRSLQTLCRRAVSSTRQTCAARQHGIWRVKLRKTPGKQVFLLKLHGEVVAQKTVSISLKAVAQR